MSKPEAAHVWGVIYRVQNHPPTQQRYYETRQMQDLSSNRNLSGH